MSGPLDVIQSALTPNITPASWATDNQARGLNVAKYRRYQYGDHDAQMTQEMRNALRVNASASTIKSAPFNSNQMDDVITTMSDRLTVDRIEGDNDAATQWTAELLDANRFDGLQMDVHEAALRDGDSYIFVDYDNDKQQVYFCHEKAWDGYDGMMVVHAASDKRDVAAAIKVWYETKTEYADTMRVNIYYPDRIEKWVRVGSEGALIHYDDPNYPGTWPIQWMYNGEPIGVPVIPFRNRTQGQGGYGKSELSDAIPLQDALNRTLHSMVIASELTAFGIYVALGFPGPAALTPGMIIEVNATEPLSKDQVADFRKIEGSSITQYMDLANFFIGRIEAVTRTPNMSLSANLSGEAMKQSEIKLIGKVKRFQVNAGNSWEDVIAMAHRLTLAFGKAAAPPAYKTWRCRWKNAEIRNDKDTVANAVAIKDIVGQKQTIANLASVYDWDEKEQEAILTQSKAEQAQRTQQMLSSFNQYPTGNNPLPMQRPGTQAMAKPTAMLPMAS